jgi:lipopolysaccharide/colanic/teichoic acid biosynthesis glycosyltransferase
MIEPLASRVARRALDLAGSLVGLLVASPVLITASVLIRAESAGPALFAQTRVGRGGRPFRIFKLRTMRAAQGAAGSAVTAANDPRITRVGRFLRRTKLDELPQLINVLRGDMSLVGPRPEVPRYVAYYPSDLGALVLSVRPGITDPVSLQFRDEQTLLAAQQDPERYYIEVLLPQKLALSARYVGDRTLASDLGIVASTIATVFLRRPAASHEDIVGLPAAPIDRSPDAGRAEE